MGDTRQYPRTADIKCPFLTTRRFVLGDRGVDGSDAPQRSRQAVLQSSVLASCIPLSYAPPHDRRPTCPAAQARARGRVPSGRPAGDPRAPRRPRCGGSRGDVACSGARRLTRGHRRSAGDHASGRLLQIEGARRRPDTTMARPRTRSSTSGSRIRAGRAATSSRSKRPRHRLEARPVVLRRNVIVEDDHDLGPALRLRHDQRGIVHVGDRERLDAGFDRGSRESMIGHHEIRSFVGQHPTHRLRPVGVPRPLPVRDHADRAVVRDRPLLARRDRRTRSRRRPVGRSSRRAPPRARRSRRTTGRGLRGARWRTAPARDGARRPPGAPPRARTRPPRTPRRCRAIPRSPARRSARPQASPTIRTMSSKPKGSGMFDRPKSLSGSCSTSFRMFPNTL